MPTIARPFTDFREVPEFNGYEEVSHHYRELRNLIAYTRMKEASGKPGQTLAEFCLNPVYYNITSPEERANRLAVANAFNLDEAENIPMAK
eukprot:Nk52_evm51s1360 gene=Nk52_evmTU51s1360